MTTPTISIDPELFTSLRQYCDQSGIRFNDFVEEALETAVEREEILQKSEEGERALKRVDSERRQAFRRGFLQGFGAGLMAGQGRFALSEKITPSEVTYNEAPFKAVTGPQLDLFK